MGERTSYPPGTFSWVDLQTDDLDGAKSLLRRPPRLGLRRHPDRRRRRLLDGQGAGPQRRRRSASARTRASRRTGTATSPSRTPTRARRAPPSSAPTSWRRPSTSSTPAAWPPSPIRRARCCSVWQPKENIGAGLVNARRRPDLERPGHARRRGLVALLQRALRLGDRRGRGLRRPVLVDHQRRPAQRRHAADHRGRASGVEPLLRLRGRRRDGGEGQRARRGDVHGPDGRAQRVALRDPARPERRGLQRLGRARWTTRRGSSQSCQSTPVSPRYAATATPRVGKKRSAPIASSMP